MCLIVTCTTARAPESWYRLAAAQNPHGAGLAWLDGAKVRFAKGLDADAAVALARELPLPFVVHFRWASVGGVTPALTHPFPLRREDPLALSGSSKRGVLFHNGTWAGWKPHLLAAACATGVEVGDGPMSDTRAMAYLATRLGLVVLDTIEGQRVAVLTPEGVRRWGLWTEMLPGVHVSNLRWVPAGEQSNPKSKRPPEAVVARPLQPRLVKDAKRKAGR